MIKHICSFNNAISLKLKNTFIKLIKPAAVQEILSAAVPDIDRSMLLNEWTKLYYCWDVCPVTNCAHIEHLYYVRESW